VWRVGVSEWTGDLHRAFRAASFSLSIVQSASTLIENWGGLPSTAGLAAAEINSGGAFWVNFT
jgi:hypothetical protein